LYLRFAWRYFRSPKSTTAISLIAWTSVVAIAVGTAALLLVLSVFNGFEGLVKSLYSDFYPEIRILPANGKFIDVSDELHGRLAAWPGVSAVSRTVEEKMILQNGSYQSVIQLKGVDDQYASVSGVPKKTFRGDYSLGTAEMPAAVLGAGVAAALGVDVGKEVGTLRGYLPRRGGGKALSAENITEIDLRYDFLRDALGLTASSVSALELKLTDVSRSTEVKQSLATWMGPSFRVEDRYEQNRSLYGIMNAERWIVYGVLSLILVVGAFTMIGALTMLILEKQTDIQILRAMGADGGVIKRIFLSEGMLLAAVGAGIGLIVAGTLIWAQQQFHLIPLGGGSFLIDHYPVEWRSSDGLLIAGTVFIIAGIASWVPASKAASKMKSLRTQ
jgi:lipoprotein-releasing system permease protein